MKGITLRFIIATLLFFYSQNIFAVQTRVRIDMEYGRMTATYPTTNGEQTRNFVCKKYTFRTAAKCYLYLTPDKTNFFRCSVPGSNLHMIVDDCDNFCDEDCYKEIYGKPPAKLVYPPLDPEKPNGPTTHSAQEAESVAPATSQEGEIPTATPPANEVKD